jgi:hypothetical protein
MESCRISRRSDNRYGGSITLALRHALESIDDEFTQQAPKEARPYETEVRAEGSD